MTPDQRTLAIWGGGALAVLIGVGIWLSSGADALDQQRAQATTQHGKYRDLYPADGLAAAEATTVAERLRDHQAAELAKTESRLVPDLPPEYLKTDVSDATSRVNKDYEEVRKRAAREQVQLSDQLPLRALHDDADMRGMQLAQLYLIRQVLDACLEAEVREIGNVDLGKPAQDPSGTYAVLPATFRVKASFAAVQKLLENLRLAHDRGIGVTQLELSHDDSGIESLVVTASLITGVRSGWKLDPVEAVRGGTGGSGATGGSGTPTRTRPTRSRSGG